MNRKLIHVRGNANYFEVIEIVNVNYLLVMVYYATGYVDYLDQILEEN